MTAKPPPPSPSARRWGWAILLMTATISLAFNVGHAIRAANGVPPILAVLYGVAPVMVALMLSHLIAIQNGGIVKRIATGIVFVGAMALSVRAIYEVLEPLAERWGLLFAAMLDLASLLALNEVLASGPRDRHTTTLPAAPPSNATSASPPPNPGALPPVLHSPVPPPATAAAPASPANPEFTGTSNSRLTTATATPRPSTRTANSARPSSKSTASAKPAPISQPAHHRHSTASGTATSSESPLAPTATSPAPPYAKTTTPPAAATDHGGSVQDWRPHLATDVATAALNFVRNRDAAGVPRRGAGAEFARQAQDAGTDLSTRQLRAYVTSACRRIDEEHT